jgi:hypothetical protein
MTTTHLIRPRCHRKAERVGIVDARDAYGTARTAPESATQTPWRSTHDHIT